MDCPDCASKIEKVISRVPGVTQANVNFASETLSVQVASPAAMQQLQKVVHELGYKTKEPLSMLTTVLQVDGMDCAEEKTLVEKALQGLPGLKRFAVNLMGQRLTVVHDARLLPPEQIISALSGVDLKASLFGSPQQMDGFWARHGRLLSTVLAGLLTASGLLMHLFGEAGIGEKVIFLLAIASGGWFIARKGMAAIRHGTLDMNFLMTVAVIGALFIDAWDEGAMVVFLFALAQVLEARSMDRARHAVRALMDLAPPMARLVRVDKEFTVAVDTVQVGDVFRLRPGEKAPLDGKIIDGISSLNQAPITGESVPVDKSPNDTVYAGSINGQGSLDVRVTHRAADTTLARVIHLIEEAQASRAPAQAFVDRFARIYTPAILVLAILVATLPTLLFGQAFDTWFYRALVLLVIACPCALVISTPVAIVSGLARGARAGVLIKGGVHLENTGQLNALAFDKTGTLTQGRPRVQDVEAFNDTAQEDLLSIAAGLESRSEHPLAQAIRNQAKSLSIAQPTIEGFQALTGRGVEGRIDGQLYRLGNHRLFEELNLCTPEVEARLERREAEGKTVVILGSEQQILGLITIADGIRSEAPTAIRRLRRLGIDHIVMLTGDNRGTARAIADQLEIDDPRAELLPADKVQAIKDLVAQNQKVGMVGDGVNDAPAMAAATVGIAMGAAGTDAALETADMVLMGDDLSKLPFAIRLSRTTLSVIRQNIGLAIGIKATFLVLAITGMATLWMAVFADVGASLIVVTNSLRLLRFGSASESE
ncbi:MAG TPA: cadmium-translocating P-type ATPase [Acidiferrobacteraceae bacterium]|nr:cadmium-translocating P-type ATPase [Acidiferrobacteraceae bacterium]